MFEGFSKQIIQFFFNLENNNTKEWFDHHKNDYETFVKKPAEEFVVDLGAKLNQIVPGIHAIPKVNQSLFRLNRDVRFSHDKRPYKTNLGIWFWEGTGKRMECPGFYVHFDVNNLMLGAGYYIFPKHLLDIYRQAVVDNVSGSLLQQTAKKLSAAGYTLKGASFKRLPKGYDATHANASFLLHNGLHTGVDLKIPVEFFNRDLLDLALEHFHKMLPLHEWLKTFINPG